MEKYITGLTPDKVIAILKKLGFSTKSRLSEDYGYEWRSIKTVEGVDYQVEILSSSLQKISVIKITEMVDAVTTFDIRGHEKFLSYFSQIEFEGSDPELMSFWLGDNFNKNAATITVGGVMFSIFCPNDFLRLLTIRAV